MCIHNKFGLSLVLSPVRKGKQGKQGKHQLYRGG